jgi:phosphoribosylformylglycinamidine cyclo-ligase
VLPDTCAAEIDLTAINVPPVFSWLAAVGGVARNEMLRTFNCGVGMIVVVAAEEADRVTLELELQGETVMRVGKLVEAGEERVIYRGELVL